MRKTNYDEARQEQPHTYVVVRCPHCKDREYPYQFWSEFSVDVYGRNLSKTDFRCPACNKMVAWYRLEKLYPLAEETERFAVTA